jgi:hypothetical protein
MSREGVPLLVIQRQLGHTNLGITSVYLQGIDNTEIIDTVHARRARWSPSTARSRTDAATGGRKAAPRPPPALVKSPHHEPVGTAIDPQTAPFIAKQPCRQRKAACADRAKEHSRCEAAGLLQAGVSSGHDSRREVPLLLQTSSLVPHCCGFALFRESNERRPIMGAVTGEKETPCRSATLRFPWRT